MNFNAVYHRTSDNLCYPLNEEELVINIKTGYDVKQVFLCYGDPFTAGILGGCETDWKYEREEIASKKRLEHHLWWTIIVKPEYKRCRYYFECITETETWFYFEDGFYQEEQLKNTRHTLKYFTFPWMNSVDISVTPKWVNEAVWYQIFPDRFCNGDSRINPEGVKPWAGPNQTVSNREEYGGDLQGIINKLDYLQDLGITGIYLTPINEADSIHKYDTKDYKKIDPAFGDEKVMRQLVEKAHQKGIRIMVDGVFNHSGTSFALWQDVMEKGKESEYFDWFMINKWPLQKCGTNSPKGIYYTFALFDGMPKLNTNNPKVREYILDICDSWVEKYDIDGLRLDVANEISHKLCKELREKMKSQKEDFYILGEIWHDSISWLRGDEFDAVMNYPLTSTISDFWIEEGLGKLDFEYAINRCYSMYMEQNNDALFNLLDSHDTIRAISRIKDINKVYQQLAVLFTMPGSPCIYYGTEVVLEGDFDPDCRRCMPWKEIEAGMYDDRRDIVKKLIALRKGETAFRSRNLHFLNRIEEPRVLEYTKTDEKGNQIEVILNCSQKDIIVEEKGELLFSNLYDNGVLKANGAIIRK